MSKKTGVKIVGLDKIQANTNRMVRGIKGRTRDGVLAAVYVVQNTAMDYTPVLTGNLKGSHFGRVEDTPGGPVGILSNAAAYSLSVHELNVPFYQLAMADEQTRIVEIITSRARI